MSPCYHSGMDNREVNIQDAPRAAALAGNLPVIARPQLWVVALVLYALLLGLPWLGTSPLMSHEVLVAQRTQGLMNEGEWVVPFRDGRADFNKPPLPFWITGSLSALAGEINEWTIRLPSVAATIGTMLLLVFYTRRLLCWRTALVTGWVFLTSVAVLQYGRRGEVDMLLTFWTSLALVAYATGLVEPNRRRQVAWFLTMWLAAGVAVLAKGPLPVGILLVTMILTAVFCPEGRRIGRMLPILGPASLVAVVAAWAVPVALMYPEAVSVWAMESLGRFAGKMGHEKPLFYYVFRAPTLWLPWILPVAVGANLVVRKRTLPRLQWVLLLAWGLGGLVLLSASTGKRVHYVLPVMPPFLVLAGLGLDGIVFAVSRKLARSRRVLFWLHVATVPGALVAALVGLAYLPKYGDRVMALALVFAAAFTRVLWLYYTRRRTASMLTMVASFATIQVIAVGLLLTPLSLAVGREAAIGRAIAAREDVPACAFVTPEGEAEARSAKTVTFYAGRRLTTIRGRDAMRRWRADHPGGLVLVGKQDVAVLRSLGAWTEPLPPEDPKWSESDFDLLSVPTEVAAHSPADPSKGPRGPKEMSDAK